MIGKNPVHFSRPCQRQMDAFPDAIGMPNSCEPAENLIRRIQTLCGARELWFKLPRPNPLGNNGSCRSTSAANFALPHFGALLFNRVSNVQKECLVESGNANLRLAFQAANREIGVPREKNGVPAKPGRREKRFLKMALRFLRRAPQKRGHVEIIRSRRIFLVNDFVDGGTRRFLRNLLRLHDHFFLAPGLPRLRADKRVSGAAAGARPRGIPRR